MTSTADVARWRRNLQGEVDGALIYRAMAANAGDDGLAALYFRMAEAKRSTPPYGVIGCVLLP